MSVHLTNNGDSRPDGVEGGQGRSDDDTAKSSDKALIVCVALVTLFFGLALFLALGGGE